MKDTTVFDVNRDEALELTMSVKGQDTRDNIKNILKCKQRFLPYVTMHKT